MDLIIITTLNCKYHQTYTIEKGAENNAVHGGGNKKQKKQSSIN